MNRHLCTVLLTTALLTTALVTAGPLAAPAAAQNRGATQDGRRGEADNRVVPPATRGPLRADREPMRQWRPQERRGPFLEPAFARGYDDGFERGSDDSDDHDRYDPVGHRDYRRGDVGYTRDYGSRDAYKNNYRAGFRQGYDEGYKDGTRGNR